jgi:uncharacterized protein YktA (UPF0223 family)
MKNYLGTMVLASAALTACAGAQPDQKTEPVTIQLQDRSDKTQEITAEKDEIKRNKPEPVVEITQKMRWRLHNMNECGSKNWATCGREVTDLFWKLTKKIPKDVDRKCREDGDYEEGCVEKAYEQHVGNDALLQEYTEKDIACKSDYDQCTSTAEANCDQKCWREVKEILEKEQKEMDDQSKDWTTPKNP